MIGHGITLADLEIAERRRDRAFVQAFWNLHQAHVANVGHLPRPCSLTYLAARLGCEKAHAL